MFAVRLAPVKKLHRDFKCAPENGVDWIAALASGRPVLAPEADMPGSAAAGEIRREIRAQDHFGFLTS
jgi:hypothetical protein